jgi:hypothetical protein
MRYSIVLFKSLRNSKRLHKGNFMLKSQFLGLLTISKWNKQYFSRKRFKNICIQCQINLTIRQRPKEEYWGT